MGIEPESARAFGFGRHNADHQACPIPLGVTVSIFVRKTQCMYSVLYGMLSFTRSLKNRHNNKINNMCPFKKALTLDILPYHQCTNPGFKQV